MISENVLKDKYNLCMHELFLMFIVSSIAIQVYIVNLECSIQIEPTIMATTLRLDSRLSPFSGPCYRNDELCEWFNFWQVSLTIH